MANYNIYHIFKGAHKIEKLNQNISNDTIILTSMNSVIFCGNFTLENYTAGSVLGKLDTMCTPKEKVALPICYYDGAHKTAILIINNTGTVVLNTTVTNGELYTNGLSFSINGNIYGD